MVYSLVSIDEEVSLDTPMKVADYLRSAFDENPKAFYCVYLDRKNHPLGRHLITLGTATSTLVSPKEVFRGAIVAGAVAIVVAHNHPSGDPAPSTADIQVTRQLRDASRILASRCSTTWFAVKRKPIRTVAVSTPSGRRAFCRPVFPPGGSPPGVSFWSVLPRPVYLDAVSAGIAVLSARK